MGLRASVERLDDDNLTATNCQCASFPMSQSFQPRRRCHLQCAKDECPGQSYLLSCVSASGDDGHAADFEDYTNFISFRHMKLQLPSQLTLHRCWRRSMGVFVDGLVFEVVKIGCGRVGSPSRRNCGISHLTEPRFPKKESAAWDPSLIQCLQ